MWSFALLFFFFWLRRVLVAACRIFVEAWGSFIVVHGLLSSCGMRVFASLVVARRLQGVQVVVAHGLSCPAACGILVP